MAFLKENEDSDQSISEDEGADCKWSRNCISLGSASQEQGNIRILSQLETLKDVHKHDCATKLTNESQQKQKNLCIEDEVELPIFNNEDHFSMASASNSDNEIGIFPVLGPICNSEEEIISDDEKLTVGNVKERESSPSRESRHTKAAFCSNENSGASSVCGTSSKLINPSNGRRGKAKHKFLFRFQREKEDIPFVVHGTNKSSELNRAPRMFMEKLMDSSDNMQQTKIGLLEHDGLPSQIETLPKSSERSMAELLDCFQEKRGLHFRNSIKHGNIKRRRLKQFPKRNISPLGDRNATDDGILETSDSEPLSDGEEKSIVLKSVAPGRTIADQFHEVLGSDSMNDGKPYIPAPGQQCGGLFANLQRVMLSEKERDTNFLNNLCLDAGLNGEKLCLDVRILSSYLEAKLTICHCTLEGDEKGNDLQNRLKLKSTNGGCTLTVIFSSKICSDVELDKGSLIRIYPPWKEVNNKDDNEVIILSKYFSRISSD